MRDHLLGFPPALLALDPEPRVSRETPPREIHGKVRTVFEALDYVKWRGKDNANIGNWSRDWLDTSPQPDAEGWIAHTPGPCPVGAGVMLDHRLRGHSGFTTHRCCPDGPGWGHGYITHYRVVK